MLKYDYHMHSDYSSDARYPMEQMIIKSISLGLEEIALTDHYDFIFPDSLFSYQIDYDQYQIEFEQLKEKYADQIRLIFGVEIGIGNRCGKKVKELIQKYSFDFVIGSVHDILGLDLYTKEYFKGKEKKAAYQYYFEYMLESIRHTESLSVLGHFDYISRYGPYEDPSIFYMDYKEEIDEILKEIVHRNIGLEINTSGYRYGINMIYPQRDILKRYLNLGGEIITFGSDAHKPQDVASQFKEAREIAKECGIQYFTVFKDMKPKFIPL